MLDDMLRVKAELDALPPPLLAVKCHPADANALRRANRPTGPTNSLLSMFSVELFVSLDVPRGRCVPAYDRALVNAWRLEGYREHLLTVLRRRLRALEVAG